MKIRWKHIVSSALALAFCLSLAACGSGDVAGEDWRTSGMVAASGTITHDGESVDVLVTVSESSAAFYRDLPEQVLFDSVSFPMNIPDAEQAFNAIFLEDLDGDGESDVLVSFIHENGDETELVWIWDPVERYVFREDLSTVAISGGADDGALLPACGGHPVSGALLHPKRPGDQRCGGEGNLPIDGRRLQLLRSWRRL